LIRVRDGVSVGRLVATGFGICFMVRFGNYFVICFGIALEWCARSVREKGSRDRGMIHDPLMDVDDLLS
jgi:hypothetical protein